MDLRVESVNKVFTNDGKQHTVLNNISFTVKEGQFITLLGPSGCGKTTLLSIIAGFQEATCGQVSINGRKVTKPGPDRGFVFQNYALFPWMTVKENILYPMKRQKMARQDREKRLQDLLAMAQLTGKENLLPQQLSGGMKQRTAFIRALAGQPDVLLMDEPLGAVDFQMRQILQEELEALWLKDRTTVIMVTHDVDEAVYLSDRVIVMSAEQGRILEDYNVELERPRQRTDEKYNSHKSYLTNLLRLALGNKPDLRDERGLV